MSNSFRNKKTNNNDIKVQLKAVHLVYEAPKREREFKVLKQFQSIVAQVNFSNNMHRIKWLLISFLSYFVTEILTNLISKLQLHESLECERSSTFHKMES